MKRLTRFLRSLDCPQGKNGLSASVALFALIFLYLESSPTPAGADVARRPTSKNSLVISAAKPAVEAKSEADTIADAELTPEQRAEKALSVKIAMIEKGLEFLQKTPDYTAQFTKQELVRGELLDEQEMEMKVRHAPFSIYLKWVTGEAGREVLFVDGQNEGKMTAHGGGWKARLPAVSLELTSSLALAESRHPITKAGLLELARTMLTIHREDLTTKRIAKCEKLADQSFDGRPCHAYLIEYKDPKCSEHYRKSISLIDKEWSIPVYTRNFGWLNGEIPEDPEQYDVATLVEFYSYSNVKFRSNLIAADFDHTNEEYRFKRQ